MLECKSPLRPKCRPHAPRSFLVVLAFLLSTGVPGGHGALLPLGKRTDRPLLLFLVEIPLCFTSRIWK